MKNKEKIIATGCILVLSVIFLIAGYFINKEKDGFYNNINQDIEENVFELDNKEIKSKANDKNNVIGESEKTTIVVDIKGAIKNPKEYQLPQGSRVRDLIDIAGGLTEDADNDRIYFSKILQDEQCIKIYKKGEILEAELNEHLESNQNGNDNSNNSGKININKATMEQLNTLPGIGDVKAKSIIDYREKNGGFKTVDELNNIDGIGSKTVDKLRDKVDIK